jgi:hypothetical protein
VQVRVLIERRFEEERNRVGNGHAAVAFTSERVGPQRLEGV